jgi:ATPase subunit of ABC transporter with duplicated ATPase domains
VRGNKFSRFFLAMSKFAAAAAKAAGKSAAAPKPAAKAGASAAVSKAPAKAAVVLKTIDEKKKYAKKHELKMEDLAQEIKDEPNKKTKTDLENNMKKLQADATYLKAVEDVKAAELQAAKDAERAALKAVEGASKDFKRQKSAEEEAQEDITHADEEKMAEIDAAFAAGGKDAAAAKAQAVASLEAFAASTPFVLPRLDKLISLFGDSKLGGPAIKSAMAIVAAIQPRGHGIASVVMPTLLAGIDDKKWKVKAGCIEVLVPCLDQMSTGTPSQLGAILSQVVPKLAEAALEVRAEIRTATATVLRRIGELVASPEIKTLSQDLVTALAEPTNQKHTQSVLAKMGNQTFLSLIDAASLSLLMPVVVRGLKERDSMSKKWSAQIFGSSSMLVKDVEIIEPYLKTVLPLLQTSLTDPVPEVQREGAKAFGILEQILPEYSRITCQPWLFTKLRGGEVGEQIGASLALAEVLLKMDKERAAELMPEIEKACIEIPNAKKRGFMELMEATPHAMKMDYVPFIERTLPTMLMSITGDKDEDTGYRAALSLVQRFGDLCPELLLPSFETCYAATLYAVTPEDRARQVVLREKIATLLGKVADKILEHKRFGQDLLTTEDCATKETREYLLCLVQLMRWDADAAVKRQANGSWKNVGGAPKLQKAIMPSFEKLLARFRSGDLGLGAQKIGQEATAQLVKDKEIEPIEGDEPAKAEVFKFKFTGDCVAGSASEQIVAGQAPTQALNEESAFQRQLSGDADHAKQALQSHPALASLAVDVRTHCAAVARSVYMEGRKSKFGGAKIAANIVTALKVVVAMCDGHKEINQDVELPLVAEAFTREALGGHDYDAVGGAAGDCAETLLYVESLLLMYGAGHLLLKDTVLEMKKNSRYGVVGQNGAGKTTLMKEIANHRIVGMPKDLKCVHVDDSKLGEMSKSHLTALEYVIKMAKDIGVTTAGRETLMDVGFEEKRLDEPVADLSTGWRMRLTLAVSMLKHADLVLLDEPTNHLDEESVEWLATYVNGITGSSVMVISHEPKFLNKTCTHILAYVDKKLEYTVGSFDAFAAKKGLSKEQIDAMLSGNLSFDTKPAGEEGEEEEGGNKAVVPVAGPPKLSFPIPGSVEGVKSSSRAVLEIKNLYFRFSKEKDYLLQDVNVKLSLNARVAICGRNGCGKSVLMTLLCSEMSPSEGKDGTIGNVDRHCNVRLSYMKQDHLKALGPFFDTSPFVYITERFKDGYDGDLQKRLIEPEDEEEADRRVALAKEHGKYNNEVGTLLSRQKAGNSVAYEVQWKNLDDPKQNTMETIAKLRMMGLDKVVIACDERIAAKAAGLDQRPLTRREVVRHVEAFGIDEEMCCNRQIRGFSAGQKVRLSLAAMFWTKPHMIAVDEPTNYLDVETVEALAKALNTFRGGIVMIEPKTDFVERICNEKWNLQDGVVTVEKLKNAVKRQA